MKATRFAVLAMCALTTGTLITGARAATNEPGQGSGPKTITVDVEAQARFGVVITTLKGATAPTGTATTARVLDPSPLLQLDSELAAAAASFAASRAEAQRTRKLFAEDRTASRRAVEAANAQEQADLQRVNGAQRRLALEWGGGLVDLQAHQRAALLNELAHARAQLVRVEIPAGLPIPKTGSGLAVRGDSQSDAFTGRVLGVLPIADPRLQTRGVLIELRGEAARLPIGEMLSAEVPTGGSSVITGVILPRSALLRRNARVWVYVQTEPTLFVRREVRDYHPVLDGWFVADGFAPGDHVVTAGAAALLGIESPVSTVQD